MTVPATPSYATEIYDRGADGELPEFPTDLTALEDAAAARMPRVPFDYVAGSAGSGATARANRAAFDRWRIVPRMLTGATDRTTGTSVLGAAAAAPLVTAPVAAQGILHPDGELALARAAGELGVPMILSSLSSQTMEDVAAANGDGVRWFQLYWPNDPDVLASFLSRAAAAGYTALVITLDLWSLGWRPRDLDNGYLPFQAGDGLANFFSDPAFRACLAAPPEEDFAAAFATWRPMFTGTDHTWDELAAIRDQWPGPIVLKGIQHPDDARRAVDAGVEGIVVSNHGGRQVDGAVASLDALPGVVEAAGGQVEILFDSGVRTGADVLKAVALGAGAAVVGRPWAYGLGLGGYAGVRHVLRCLLTDFDLALALSGHRAVTDLGPHSLDGGAAGLR
jgi:isopentenyl diphosphate isomerase/L-lactate dehydrogenase-like FMN-dependent dehydrogenase